MKIIHPTPQIPPRDSHGGPKGSAPAGTGDTTTTGGTTSTDPAVNVDLSPGAQGVIAAGKGNSVNSPAHQAQNYFMSLSGTEEFKNFGQMVSRIAHGILPGSSGSTGDEPAVDGTDPVIDETGSTAPIDDGATTTTETGDTTASGEEGSTDIVVEEPIITGDDVIVDETTATDETIVDETAATDETVVTVENRVADGSTVIADEPVADEPVADDAVVTVDEPVVTDAELIDELTTDTTETV